MHSITACVEPIILGPPVWACSCGYWPRRHLSAEDGARVFPLEGCCRALRQMTCPCLWMLPKPWPESATRPSLLAPMHLHAPPRQGVRTRGPVDGKLATCPSVPVCAARMLLLRCLGRWPSQRLRRSVSLMSQQSPTRQARPTATVESICQPDADHWSRPRPVTSPRRASEARGLPSLFQASGRQELRWCKSSSGGHCAGLSCLRCKGKPMHDPCRYPYFAHSMDKCRGSPGEAFANAFLMQL